MAPRVVAITRKPAEQLPLHRIQLVRQVRGPDAVVLIPHGDPPVRISKEHGFAGKRRIIVRTSVPQPPVEQHHIAGGRRHLERSLRVRPLDVTPRRPVDPVGPVAARHDLEVAATRM
jgi:hypothetical protein